MAQLSSSKAKALALAMTGIAATSLATSTAFGQSAQQVAMPAQCAQIASPGAQAQCVVDTITAQNLARTAAANQRTAVANQRVMAANGTISLNGCLEFLVQQKGPLPPITEQNACTVAVSKGYRPAP